MRYISLTHHFDFVIEIVRYATSKKSLSNGFFGKNTAAETLKNFASFSICSTVNLRLFLSTSETIDSVLKIGTKSFCFRFNSAIKTFKSSTP